jgi:hypothetical protein
VEGAIPAGVRGGGFDSVIGNPPYVRQEWIKADKPFLEEHYKAYDGVADLYVYFYELGLNLLKPGGRLGFIVTNKWMKAGYGEALRKLYGESAWVESVVDFGHAKQIFPDADVFPSILVARKPTVAKPPAKARVCVIPREQLRIDDLSRQIQTEGVAVPRKRFGADPWTLEPPSVAKLMEKIRAMGAPLKEYAGAEPHYGVKTGCNDAFIVSTQTRNRLISEHDSSKQLLKKYLRGQDIDRWNCEWSGDWMIFARRGIKIDNYPAVKKHLLKYKSELEPKPDDWQPTEAQPKWPGRKPGSYKWYELQDAVDYWQEFSKSKIIWPDLCWRPSFLVDSRELFINDTTFCLVSTDLWLLAVLNSPLMWAWLWRNCLHGKDEVLRLKSIYTEKIPVAKPLAAIEKRTCQFVSKLIEASSDRQSSRRAVADWLQVEFDIEKPRSKYFDGKLISEADFVAEVHYHRKKAKKTLSVAAVKHVKEQFAAAVEPLNALAKEADRLERQVSDLVNEAYGLTPDEVKLMWDTAPPRMPVRPPE